MRRMQQEEQNRMPEIISNKDRLRWHGRRMFFVVGSLRLHRRLFAGMIGSRQCSLGLCLHASPVQPERPRAAQLYVLIGNFSMFTLTWIGLIPKHMELDASAGASLSGGGPLTDCPATAGGMLMSMSGAGWTYFVISILLMVPLTGANLNLGERNGQPCDWCRQPAVYLQ
jgi:hypothetical protein